MDSSIILPTDRTHQSPDATVVLMDWAVKQISMVADIGHALAKTSATEDGAILL